MQAGSFKTGKKFYIDTMMLSQLSSEFSVIRLEFDLGSCELFRIKPAGKSEQGSYSGMGSQVRVITERHAPCSG